MRKAEPKIVGVRKDATGDVTHIQLSFEWSAGKHYVWVNVEEVEQQWQLPSKPVEVKPV